jgi:hypothetical protein
MPPIYSSRSIFKWYGRRNPHPEPLVSEKREGCPGVPWGLAFETWDPRNHCFMDTHDLTIGKKITVPAR